MRHVVSERKQKKATASAENTATGSFLVVYMTSVPRLVQTGRQYSVLKIIFCMTLAYTMSVSVNFVRVVRINSKAISVELLIVSKRKGVPDLTMMHDQEKYSKHRYCCAYTVMHHHCCACHTPQEFRPFVRVASNPPTAIHATDTPF